jgi:hypothetical protein
LFDSSSRNATAQLDYSGISKRWTYPSFFYVIDYELEDGTSMRLVLGFRKILMQNQNKFLTGE